MALPLALRSRPARRIPILEHRPLGTTKSHLSRRGPERQTALTLFVKRKALALAVLQTALRAVARDPAVLRPICDDHARVKVRLAGEAAAKRARGRREGCCRDRGVR